MIALRLDDLRQHSDVLRLRSGEPLTVRFVEPRDAEALQNYFRSLSARSRYNRFLGAMSELPKPVLDHFIHVGEDDRFSVVATMTIDGFETIVGEARYAFDPDTESFEFGLSIDDRWQGQGIGSALLKNLECRAAAFGATRLFGDTLRSNEAMIGAGPQVRLCLHATIPTTGSWCASKSTSTSRRRKFPAPAGGLRRNRSRSGGGLRSSCRGRPSTCVELRPSCMVRAAQRAR